MKLVVTGATGYIGSRLASIALESGHDVVAASRSRPAGWTSPWLHFDLSAAGEIAFPAGTGAVIHLAANTSPDENENGDAEVRAAHSLIAAARQVSAKIIFVSSQTARADAPTVYGRTKWRIEQDVLAAGGWIVRPGQVYGGAERGLFGLLTRAVRRLPLIPAFLPAPKVQPIHVDDLAQGLLNIAQRGDLEPGLFRLASPEPVSFTCFLSTIASRRARRRILAFPIPTILVKLAAACLGERLRRKTGLERLLSLFELPRMNSASDLARLGLSLRSLSAGMHPSGCDTRRRLAHEARSMLAYVLREAPHVGLIRRHVRAVEKLRDGSPLNLPSSTLRFPVFLRLLDERTFVSSAQGAEFFWRLDAATLLAEATPVGARRFLGTSGHRHALLDAFRIGRAVISEILWRLVRPVCSPLIRNSR